MENSFLITDAKASPLIKELKLGTIRRFVIYNGGKKVFIKNASSPDSNEIKKIFGDLSRKKRYKSKMDV